MKDDFKEHLETFARDRERRFKDRGIVNFLLGRNQMRFCTFESVNELVEFVQDYNSCDRYWRLILSEYPHLQGNDYDDKEMYEQKKEIELGYEADYKATQKEVMGAVQNPNS